MIKEIGEYIIDCDAEKTRNFYLKYGFNNCKCKQCRNFSKYAKNNDYNDIIEFFRQFGIDDLRYISELVHFIEINNEYIYCSGFYHICGKILKKGNRDVHINKDFTVSFCKGSILVPINFPKDVIQVEFETKIPLRKH